MKGHCKGLLDIICQIMRTANHLKTYYNIRTMYVHGSMYFYNVSTHRVVINYMCNNVGSCKLHVVAIFT